MSTRIYGETISWQRLFYQRLLSKPINNISGKIMAHLEVEPKPSRPWWVWLLIALFTILLAGMLISKCSAEGDTTASDSISTDTSQVVATENLTQLLV